MRCLEPTARIHLHMKHKQSITAALQKLMMTMAVFILETRYPSGRASENILQIIQLSVSSIKTGTRRVTRLDELLFETRLERRISKSSSSRRVTRLLPVFILETDNRTSYKMFAEARPDGLRVSSIKTAN